MVKNSSESGGKYVSVHLRFEEVLLFVLLNFNSAVMEELENDWKTIKFYEKLEKEMCGLVRCSLSFPHLMEIFSYPSGHPPTNWIPWKTRKL